MKAELLMLVSMKGCFSSRILTLILPLNPPAPLIVRDAVVGTNSYASGLCLEYRSMMYNVLDAIYDLPLSGKSFGGAFIDPHLSVQHLKLLWHFTSIDPGSHALSE
jgi:hypothetical protein